MNLRHPYVGKPDRQFWKKEPGIGDPTLFDPVSDVKFAVSATDKVVTAGSCFAQHVARFLTEAGFNHYIAEPAHVIFSARQAEEFNYGLFSARYGNIYTARQLLQLLKRAFGRFTPLEVSWPLGSAGRVVDPFRPQIQPEGFVSEAELIMDRLQHFAAIRQAIGEADVFVFTLGLTECWEDIRDGAIYPLAPGVAGGVYTPETVRFRNFDDAETTADLLEALRLIREINPDVRFILTVSPVPLNATMEDRHVFVSTTWSKAVLRLSAERICKTIGQCSYFPSYEIITSPFSRGQYYGQDCREVLHSGVEHVMGLFLKHFAGKSGRKAPEKRRREGPSVTHLADLEMSFAVQCDEEAITNR